MSDSNSQQTNQIMTEEQQQMMLLRLLQAAAQQSSNQQTNRTTASSTSTTSFDANANSGMFAREEDMDAIISRLMASDRNVMGPPPAAKTAINDLVETTIDERDLAKPKDCGVCGERLQVGDYAKQLPCKHWFHADECLHPWLQLHNTCPLCRYELPTMDLEYDEKQREQREKIQKKQAKKERENAISMMYL
eukprot:TRINITY_DN4091_c0_g1_i2.p1 TRINITY_DN4091_c0_g1~~TRINITY_DN4091_c0_g1_i2.p1  ORF type:complete len:192 (+),score=22.38 TRINITY_DN4091_c0_g1_i2:157-732(+)